MGASLDAAAALVVELREAGIAATLDITEVAASAPCVLVPPPRWGDWGFDGSPTFTWRLVAIASQDVGNLDAWAELDELVSAVCLALPVELAEPIAYTLPSTGAGTRPAYAVTLTRS